MCHSAGMAKELSRRLAQSCEELKGAYMEPNKSYELCSEEGNCNCSRDADFAMHELQLLRVEKQYVNRNMEQPIEELFLGDIDTELHRRMSHRPSSYQPPLQNAKVSACACMCINALFHMCI